MEETLKLTSVDHNLETLLCKSGPRTEGLHISSVYGDLFSDLEPNRYKRDSLPNPLKLAIGLAWESWLERVFVNEGILAERPDSRISPEGIHYSPDLFVVNGMDRIGEIKFTWMSCNTDISDPKFDKWLVQAKIYAYWEGMMGARFYVLFVNGNYRDNREPTFKVWDVDFSQRELDDNFLLLMNHAKHKGML